MSFKEIEASWGAGRGLGSHKGWSIPARTVRYVRAGLGTCHGRMPRLGQTRTSGV